VHTAVLATATTGVAFLSESPTSKVDSWTAQRANALQTEFCTKNPGLPADGPGVQRFWNGGNHLGLYIHAKDDPASAAMLLQELVRQWTCLSI